MNWTKLTAYGGAGVVGVVAAVVSFGHLRALATAAGESATAAALLPVSVDGLLVSAAAVMWMDNQAGRRARMSARVAFATGCAATVCGNIASANPTLTGWLVAAWAPLALLLVTEMLARRGRRVEPESAPDKPLSGTQSAPKRSTPTRVPAKPRKSTGDRVAAAVARTPEATPAQIASRLRLSERTVQRYRPTAPDATGGASFDAPGTGNGHRPGAVVTGPASVSPTEAAAGTAPNGAGGGSTVDSAAG